MKPKLLDLFCCQGGAGEGYRQAGFQIVGVDIEPQPRNPHDFHQADAFEFLARYGKDFDLIHCSPPCQAYTMAQRIRKRRHPDLIGPLRNSLVKIGKPYVIENTPGAPLIEPVMLCGRMFGMRLFRHRIFETNWKLPQPDHAEHDLKQVKMGRPANADEIIQIVGNFSGVAAAREVMGMPWANRDGLREAIPPQYTNFVGGHWIKQHWRK